MPHNAEVFENWIKNDYTPEIGKIVESWVVNDYTPVVESWINEENEKEDGKSGNKDNGKSDKDGDKGNKETGKKGSEEKGEGKGGGSDKSNSESGSDKGGGKGDEKPKKESDKVDEQATIFTSNLLKSINESEAQADKMNDEEEEEEEKKVDEAHFGPTAPVWLRLIPESLKPQWLALDQTGRERIRRKTALRSLNSVNEVSRFWQGIDFTPTETGNKRTRQIAESQNHGRNSLVQMARSLQGRK
jgi:hypothetical protein